MRRNRIFILAIITIALMIMALACGGGGGGSEQVTYEGENMPSVIGTTDTAVMVSLAKRATLGGQEAEGAIPSNTNTVRVPSDPGAMIPYTRDFLSGFTTPAKGGVQSLSVAEPLAGDCLPAETYTDGYGGYYTEELCVGATSLSFTMTAVGYDDGFEAMDGTVIMEMDETSATVIFRDYYYSNYGSEDFYADGIVTYVENSAIRTTITYDLSLYNFNDFEGAWLNNYRIVVDEDAANEQDIASISGRFYDYNRGYVDIVTVTPLVFPWNQDYPVAGELQLTGGNGYWVKIRFDLNVSTPVLQVEINCDDDPEYEWISGWEPWVLIT